MSSAYRIFVNGQRVATAVNLADGQVLQTYPEREVYSSQDIWVFYNFWVNRDGATSYTLGLPDGSSITYGPERYTLFHGGRCVSAGVRVGSVFAQRYPIREGFMSRDRLFAERAPHFGVKTYLRIKAKVPTVVPAPPKVRRVVVPLTEEQRNVLRARLTKARAVKAARAAARKEQAAPSTPPREVRFLPNPLAPKKPSYWTSDMPGLDPSMRMLLSILGPVARSGEGCDCGEC